MKLFLTIAILITALLITTAGAQRRDPLTTVEADQLREAAQEPIRRLPLIVKFARARMTAIVQLQADPKASPDRGAKMHDLLEDFGLIIDELDDNIDDYDARNQDLRKPLKEVIDADTEFQAKLKTLKEAGSTDKRIAAEMKDYAFVLDNAIDAVNTDLDNARKTLADQIANKGELKKK